jgi:hypothetical protein
MNAQGVVQLFDMRPVPTIDNSLDVRSVRTNHFSDLVLAKFARFPKAFYLAYLGLCQFMLWILRATKNDLAPFLDHILRVFRRGTEEKMFRITAPAVIAFVQNPKAIGDLAIGEFPCNSVRLVILAPYRKIASASVFLDRALILPANIGGTFQNLFPKSFINAFHAAYSKLRGAFITACGSLLRKIFGKRKASNLATANNTFPNVIMSHLVFFFASSDVSIISQVAR